MLRPMTMRLLAVPLLLTLAACTGGNEAASRATARPATPSAPSPVVNASQSPSAPASPRPGVLVERNCLGDCNAGFALNGKHYFLNCTPISPKSVAKQVAGRGTLYGRRVTVRKVQAGPHTGKTAVGPMSGYCGPGQPAA